MSLLYRNNIIDYNSFIIGIKSYNEMLKWGSCGRLLFRREVIEIIEKYYKYKVDNDEYICLIRVGSFYETFECDAYIMNCIFGYKIKLISNHLRVGFPKSKIDDICSILRSNNINYVVIKDSIVDRYSSDNNMYSSYSYDKNKNMSRLLSIDRIIKSIENNMFNLDISTIKQIENVLEIV